VSAQADAWRSAPKKADFQSTLTQPFWACAD